MPRTRVPPAHDEVVGELALARSDVEHELAGSNALDEEVVVASETMLWMHSLLVRDRRQVELPVHVVVGHEQLANGTPPVRVGPEHREPEPRQRSPEPQRHHEPKRAARNATPCGTGRTRGPATGCSRAPAPHEPVQKLVPQRIEVLERVALGRDPCSAHDVAGSAFVNLDRPAREAFHVVHVDEPARSSVLDELCRLADTCRDERGARRHRFQRGLRTALLA